MHSTTTAIPARAIGRARVTQSVPTSTQTPPFAAYFEDLQKETGLNDVELSALTGLDKSNFSHWRSGRTIPQSPALRVIAPHVNRLHGELLVAAGHSTPEELGMVGGLSDLPKPIEDVVRTVKSRAIDAEDRTALVRAIENIHDLFWRNVARRPAARRK